ncbi:MAG: agmatinase [Bacillota bacterium]|nr:agmatinase [Bacillota bacterium]
MEKKEPWREIKTGAPQKSDIIIYGVPFDGAVSNLSGAAEAPNRIRKLSAILPPFSEEGTDLRDLIIADQGNACSSDDWSSFYRKVKKEAFDLIASERFNLFLGGDHSVTIPLAGAFAEHYHPHKVGMIHLDSHCDLMDTYDGRNWSHACPQRRFLELDNTSPDNLVLIGIRSYEAEEREFLKENPSIKVIGARQFHYSGLEYTLETVYQAMQDVKAVYISLDIDVLDPAFAPGTGTPEAGGLMTREVIEIVRELIINLPVKSMDLVEVAPPVDHSDITSWAALKIIYEVFAAYMSKTRR